MNVFVCPKCLGRMTTVERHRVVFERCSEYGGIFLDRGELEQLIRGEIQYYERQVVRDDEEDAFEKRRDDRRKNKKKFRHFLEELLDFD